MRLKRTAVLASGVSLAIALTGCVDLSGSDDSGSDDSSQTITGTAAQGAPLKDAPVLVRCTGDGTERSVTTDETGAFEVQGLSESSFPCGLKATIPGSQSQEAFFGAAQESGKANVTPYTDMVMSSASDMAANKWFEDIQSNGFNVNQTRIDEAVEKINGELEKLGLSVGTKNPMTADFEIGDDYDRTMDRFMAGLENAGEISNFREFSDVLKDGNQNLSELIPNVPDSIPEDELDDPQTPPSGDGTLAECWNESLFSPGHTSSFKVEVSGEGERTKSVSVENREGSKVAVTQQIEGSLSTTQILDINTTAKRTTALSSTTGGNESSYSPGLPTEYSLAEGESNSFEYTVVPVNHTGDEATINQERTFKGIETIDLPNLSGVQACRVVNESTSSAMDGTTTSNNWYAVDSGILLRNQVEGQVKEEFAGSELPSY